MRASLACLVTLALAPTVVSGRPTGAFYDPKHYVGADSFAGLRFLAEGPNHILSLVGTDDGKSWWALTGGCIGQDMDVVTFDFTPKGGPLLAGRYSIGTTYIEWLDGNRWHEWLSPPGPLLDSPAFSMVDWYGRSGAFIDPNHYGGPSSYAGMRFLAGAPSDPAKLTLVGTDDGKSWWAVKATVGGSLAEVITIDFSPKGGPADAEGRWVTTSAGSTITFPDGNVWKQAYNEGMDAYTTSSISFMAYFLAIISAVCNATFFAPNRLESVKAASIHPIIYNWYTTMGVFVFSWVIALGLPLLGMSVFTFVTAGFIAGTLFTLALLFSCLALPLLGLSTAMGVWCGAATLVSFLWGTAGPAVIARPLANVPLSLFGIMAITCGILGIIYCDALGARWFGTEAPTPSAADDATEAEEGTQVLEDSMAKDGEEEAPPTPEPGQQRALGIFYALCVGCFGGSMLAPLSFVPAEFAGINSIGFMPSFGTGSLVAGTVIANGYMLRCASRGETVKLEPPATLWAGLVSGNVWNFGNLCQVIAQAYFGLPYAIAYPIFQASLVASGLLGIFVFKEIVGKPSITAFFVSAFVVVVGAGLLALYGPQQG